MASYALAVPEVRTRDAPTQREDTRPFQALAVIGALAGALVIVHQWGDTLVRAGHVMKVGVPPLHAVYEPRVGVPDVPAVLLAVAVLLFLPRLAHRARWPVVLVASTVAATAWTVAVNATDGRWGLVHGLDNRHEYLADVHRVGSPFVFLRGFTDHISEYATHTRGHPPGFVLVLWFLDRLGLSGAGWAAALCIGAAGIGVAAVLITVRDIAGEQVARAAMPFVAIAPVALWVGSSADAFFACLGAVAVALIVRAIVAPRPGAAVLGGIALGVLLLCSYGLVLLALIPVSLARSRARLAALGPAVAGAIGVLTLAYAAGFNYFDGMRATRAAYFRGVASMRPLSYALVANLVTFALVLGPAVVVACTRLRDRRVWSIVAPTLFAVALADLSGMSKLEVERIWLPFALWVLPAAAVLGLGQRASMARAWLAMQIAVTLGLQIGLRTGW
jgi:methylthioxylose transferase